MTSKRHRAALIFLIITVVLALVSLIANVTYSPVDVSKLKPFPNSKFITIGRVTIHYREWPVEKAKLKGKIFLVHGLYESTFSWRNNIESFQRAGYWVVAVDMPGFGYSDRQIGVNHSDSNRAEINWGVADFIDQKEDLGSLKWILLGHSIGGIVISYMEQINPEKVATMVYADTSVIPDGISNRFVLAVLQNPLISNTFSTLANGIFARYSFVKLMLKNLYGRQPSPEEVHGYLDPLQISGSARTAYEVLVSHETVPLDFSKIKKKVLIIWAEYPKYIRTNERKFEQKFTDKIVVTIPGSRHALQEASPGEFNTSVLDFLRMQELGPVD